MWVVGKGWHTILASLLDFRLLTAFAVAPIGLVKKLIFWIFIENIAACWALAGYV